jgi:transcriptional regulator with XRE-family HTH domain
MRDIVPASPTTEGSGSRHLAAEIRAARKGKGWTLAALSGFAGLDKGYLSKVERGLKIPSVSTVLNLARVLDIPVAQMFGEAVDESAIHVSRAASRLRTSDPSGTTNYRIEALTAGKGRSGLEGFLVYPQPDFSEDFRAEHDGEELLFTLSGAIEIRFADRIVALAEGDALQFPGRLVHQVRRTTPTACVLITVSRS